MKDSCIGVGFIQMLSFNPANEWRDLVELVRLKDIVG